MVKKISSNEFCEVKANKYSVVDFSATWCGPCKMLAPVLEEISNDMKDTVAFYNIDVDENPDLAQQFGVTSIPALVVFKDGARVNMQVGFQPKEGIMNFINSNI